MDAEALLSLIGRENRTVLHLREVQGWSYDDIAWELGISRPEVAARLTRARRELIGRLRMAENHAGRPGTLRDSLKAEAAR